MQQYSTLRVRRFSVENVKMSPDIRSTGELTPEWLKNISPPNHLECVQHHTALFEDETSVVSGDIPGLPFVHMLSSDDEKRKRTTVVCSIL